jgi:hypothetical protein
LPLVILICHRLPGKLCDEFSGPDVSKANEASFLKRVLK